MTGSKLKIGCQTFTWEMLGDNWTGQPEEIIDAIATAGYTGIEITDTMIGHFERTPDAFAACLEAAGLTLVAFAFGSSSGFCEKDAVSSDLDMTRKWVDFAAGFPGALVSMGSATIMSEGPRVEKFDLAADVYNRSAEIAEAAGVGLAVHPSSHHNTLLFTRADYDEIFTRLDKFVGWVPDTGHILRGKQDMLDTMQTYASRIRYIHLKDVDAAGDWAMMGQGICDTQAVVTAAQAAPDFNGWLVVEEESKTAERDPSGAVRLNRQTLRDIGF